jgi:hypothetical protein
MSQEDKNKLNRIEELKSKLFSKNYKIKPEHHDGFSFHTKKDVPDSWDSLDSVRLRNDKNFFSKTSMFKRIFVFSIIFFILAIGYASYMFFGGGITVSNDNIDISVLGNTFVAGGEELPLIIGITNKNSSPLELVDLVVEYQKSSSDDSPQNVERLRQSLGVIPSGSVKNENIKVILFGEQGSTRKIKISIEYRVEGSNAIFVKEKFYNVSINSSPINLSIDIPGEITPNQDLTFSIKETLNATSSTSKMLLRVDYPVGFQFTSAIPAPSFGNNVWDLGNLAPGVDRDISITGKMIDVFDGEEKTFKVFTGSQSETDKSIIGIVFNSLGKTVSIKRPFIEARLFINGVYKSQYTADTKSTILGDVHWANNLDTKIDDLEIRAKISGNAVNRKTIKTSDGFYSSLEDTIIWNKNFNQEFQEINPGDYGSLTFSLSPMSSVLGQILSDPTINIQVSISGKQSQGSNAINQLNNSESKTIRIISDLGLATKLLYYSGSFKNTGPIPPKAEQETTYTAVWTISNTANNISKAQVRATLPPWVRFMGTISPQGEDLSYDTYTKEIIWNIGLIPKGIGITSSGREVSFRVAFTPSLSQVDTSPVVINDTVLTGHDDFANVDVRINKASLSVGLTNDPGFPSSGDRVVE